MQSSELDKNYLTTYLKILGVFFALYMFLVGIGGMSSAIKSMGSGVANTILTTAGNPLVSLFIGIFSTVLFQMEFFQNFSKYQLLYQFTKKIQSSKWLTIDLSLFYQT